MAQQHYRTPFKKALLQFITEPDPFLAMLKWVMTEMMRIEAEAKVGANKSELPDQPRRDIRFYLCSRHLCIRMALSKGIAASKARLKH